jgi:hypothetical protein
MAKKTWTKIGTVFKKKSGEGSYIKVVKDFMIKEGQYLQIFDPRDNPNAKKEDIDKIPNFVMFEIFDVRD